ncbi:MAG: hypothetical protein AB1631_28650, partial [Acidobacteriota bacterium]
MNESIKRKKSRGLFVVFMLVLTGMIAPVFMSSAKSGKEGAKATQIEAEGALAKARKDSNLCQELQPCVGDKITSIDTTLRDILALVAASAFADPLPLGTFKNKNNDCRRDTHNAFYDNTDPGAVATRVTFFIKNSGS